MPFDLASFASGIAGSIVVDKTKDKVTETVDHDILGYPPTKSQEEYLEDIHMLLVNFLAWLKHEQTSKIGDLWQFVTINKQGTGPAYKPSHLDNRQHFTIFSGVAVTLNCSGTGLGSFNFNVPAATWTPIDFPDGALYYLDTSAPSSSMQFWQRETNADII